MREIKPTIAQFIHYWCINAITKSPHNRKGMFMKFTNTSIRLVSICSFALLAQACNAATMEKQAEAKPADAAKAESLSDENRLTLKKGQYLSIILPETKEDSDAARQKYYKSAFPLGAKFGLKRENVLLITDHIVSDYKPSGVLFFSYPDAASEAGLSSHADWPAIKAQRPNAWSELNVHSAELSQDLDLKFDPEKSYTLVVAWTNPKKTDDYQRYLKGIETSLNEVGGRFIYKMKNPKYESLSGTESPAQLTFVEWDTLDGFTKLRNSDGYKAAAPYFTSGVKKVEFYRMTTVPKK